MKKSNVINSLKCIIVLFLVVTGNSVHAQETSSSQQRTVTGFNKIDIGGVFEVKLVQGNTESVKVSANEKVIDNIVTKVEQGTLKVYNKGKFSDEGKMTLEINFINVDEIECSGAITLESSGALKFSKLELETSGAAKTKLDVTAEELEVSISGTGNTTLSGNVRNVDLDISGAGKYKAEDLISENYTVNISGVGNAELNASKKLDISVSGSGTVKYKGEPQLKQSISGSGKVSRL